VQEQQADRDGDPMTSEGLFVQVDGARPKIGRGDVVRVSGRVAELGEGRGTLTALVELSSLQFCEKVDELPQASLIEEPPLTVGDWEALEAMGVIIEPTATVLDNSALLSRGELAIGLLGRQWVPTERFAPGAEARALAEDNARARLLLDDTSIANKVPERIAYLPSAPSVDATYRVGSEVRNLVGVLDQRLGSYRLHPYERIEVVHAPRPEGTPELPPGVRVASFNVLNFFNGDGKGGGFPTERGASSADELERQRAKILSALKAMDADVYVLLELENDGYEKRSAIEELSSRLNQARGRRSEYDYVRGPSERLGADQISVGMLYRTRKLRLAGASASLTEPPFDARHRVPLAQTFDVIKSDARFTVIANHWKSKGSCPPADPANQEQRDGQGCWNGARIEAARALLEWLQTDPTASGDADFLIVGDLNSYSQEDPIRLLAQAGYANLGHRPSHPEYSFVYQGQSGSLDHALASPSLALQVLGAAVWHINADEMPDFDYNRENRTKALDARMFRSGPFRSSDHDPLIVSFELDPPAPEPEVVPEVVPEDGAAAGG
jgi:predicted extracellular nuclease